MFNGQRKQTNSFRAIEIEWERERTTNTNAQRESERDLTAQLSTLMVAFKSVLGSFYLDGLTD